jgi:hypothetical protein
VVRGAPVKRPLLMATAYTVGARRRLHSISLFYMSFTLVAWFRISEFPSRSGVASLGRMQRNRSSQNISSPILIGDLMAAGVVRL